MSYSVNIMNAFLALKDLPCVVSFCERNSCTHRIYIFSDINCVFSTVLNVFSNNFVKYFFYTNNVNTCLNVGLQYTRWHLPSWPLRRSPAILIKTRHTIPTSWSLVYLRSKHQTLERTVVSLVQTLDR